MGCSLTIIKVLSSITYVWVCALWVLPALCPTTQAVKLPGLLLHLMDVGGTASPKG